MSEIQKIISPIDGSVYAERAAARAGDIDAAISAARTALPEWKTVPIAERKRYILAFLDALLAMNDDIAVELPVGRPPDVLITDIAMPLQDGHEMVQRLRESLGSRTPKVVIALSAFAAEKDTERSLSLGFDAHITKPFEPDFLVATIHERVLSHAD